jgi:hypothetical protein
MECEDQNKRSEKKETLSLGNINKFGFRSLSTITNNFRQDYRVPCRDLNQILHEHKSKAFCLLSPNSSSTLPEAEVKYDSKNYFVAFFKDPDEAQNSRGSASFFQQRLLLSFRTVCVFISAASAPFFPQRLRLSFRSACVFLSVASVSFFPQILRFSFCSVCVFLSAASESFFQQLLRLFRSFCVFSAASASFPQRLRLSFRSVCVFLSEPSASFFPQLLRLIRSFCFFLSATSASTTAHI